MSPDLDRAIRAARAGGDAIRARMSRSLDVRYKSADQPVTEADLASNRAIQEILLVPGSDDGWISEESPDADFRHRTWVVDPLDGTRNFVEGTGDFVVCLGLLVGGEPRLGVIYNPTSASVYYAQRGSGAFRDGSPIRCRPAPDPPMLVVSGNEAARPDFARAIGEAPRVEVGSTAWKMARVAEGGADIYLSATPKGIWDVCAGAVIVKESGGQAEALDGPYRWQADAGVTGTVAWGPGAEPVARRLAARLIESRQVNREEDA